MRETSFKTAWVRLENKNLSFKKQNRMSYGWEGMVTLSGKTALSYKSGSEISFREHSLINLT